MITEADVQLAMQTAMQTISLFASADVVINDWDVLNQAGAKAPYVVIENSETLDSRQDVQTPNTKWNIPIALLEYVGARKYKEVMDDLRDDRDAIIGMFNTGSNRSVSIAGVTIDRIRQEGNIEIYDPGTSAELIQSGAANPVFIGYRLVAEVEAF